MSSNTCLVIYACVCLFAFLCVCVLQHPGIILAPLVLFMPQMPSGQQVNCNPSRHRTLYFFLFIFFILCQFLNFLSHPSAAFSLASIRPACFLHLLFITAVPPITFITNVFKSINVKHLSQSLIFSVFFI